MTVSVQKAWTEYQKAARLLNLAVREKFQVGQPVKAFWNKEWRDGVISWVPYENGPPADHVYVKFAWHMTPKIYYMGGGVFSSIRTGDFDGASL